LAISIIQHSPVLTPTFLLKFLNLSSHPIGILLQANQGTRNLRRFTVKKTADISQSLEFGVTTHPSTLEKDELIRTLGKVLRTESRPALVSHGVIVDQPQHPINPSRDALFIGHTRQPGSTFIFRFDGGIQDVIDLLVFSFD
jgi:hypothetical protein